MQREPGSVPELRTQRWEYEERKVAVILGQSCREKRGRDRECVCVCVCVCVFMCVCKRERGRDPEICREILPKTLAEYRFTCLRENYLCRTKTTEKNKLSFV